MISDCAVRTSIQRRQQVFNGEGFEHDADPLLIQLLGHLRVVDGAHRRGAKHQWDTGQLRIEPHQRQELPAQLLGAFEEQVLDDDVGRERFDFVDVEEASEVVTR